MYDIEFYQDKDGKSEVYEYIKELKKNNSKENKQKVKKIDLYIDLLSEYGFSLTESYIKKLEGEIWELRPLRDRILFASWCNNKFILLSVFMKQTQKTPQREIEKAKRLLEDYKKRSDEK
ncbi:MAG: type II toxin-antitoxin system RelE/ParE family toxin [Clostridia bacterium]|nr:type II toxin-antitoxin system RelE/ParE family toxin [Clostridia bacterium]